ncbi:MAG: energy transducer TonB [Pyrinomonadaceae bacterium]
MTTRRNRLRRSPTRGGDAGAFDDAAREPFDGASPPFDEADESELKSLLESWRVGEASESLRARVVGSYRREFAKREEETMEGYGIAESFVGGLALAGARRGEFRLTILEQESLPRRLAAELSEVAREARLTREELRRDALGFARRFCVAYARAAGHALARENVGYGVAASFAVVLTVVVALVALDRGAARFASTTKEELGVVSWLSPVPEDKKPDATGAGVAGSGHGGGQKQKFEKPGGGGGGGQREEKPPVTGKLPEASLAQQLAAPDPHPPAITQPQLPTPPSIQADPVLFPPDPRDINYGDPKSKATEPSAGSGAGGGIGTGTGGGVGEGEGSGYGRGRDFNTGGGDSSIGCCGPGRGSGASSDSNRVFKVSEVTRRAVVTSRPEPLYTDEARRDQITGTVTLRFVLNANGTVTNIVALSRLPDGLTERAMEAARRITFTPAEKDGRRVSQWATINYNFNIY